MTVPQRLTARHLPAVIALHRAVVEGLPPGLVAHETDAFFADHLERLGRIYGVFEGDRLVAYGVLGLPVGDSPNFGRDHGLSAAELATVAHVDGVAVAADRRGAGLHRLLVGHRLAEAAACGRRIVLSTAAPDNTVSLVNLLACGLTVRGLVEKFGGRRYLLRRDIGAPARPAGESRWLPMADLPAHQRCFADGLVGWRLETRDDVPGMLFARP